MIKFSKIALILITALLINSGIVKAATTMISEGVASITSTLSDNTYRKRAVEDALQNIAISRGQALTSFTIIENGKLLFDQIQSTSKAGVLSYKILSENKKNKQYFVKIEAVVEDRGNQDHNSKISSSCRKSKFPSIDLTLSIEIDPQQFPAWAGLDNDWIFKKLSKKKFKPNVIFKSNQHLKANGSTKYNLFETSNSSKSSKNVHHIDLQLVFSKGQAERFFVKEQIIRMTANSQLKRNGKSIESKSQQFDYTIKKKFGVGIPIQSNKKIWKEEKQRIVKSIVEIINNSLDVIGCAYIRAKLKENDKNFYIDYGSFDGITKDDIFVIDSTKSDKFYFSVKEISNTKTQLKLISEANRNELGGGRFVRLVEEL